MHSILGYNTLQRHQFIQLSRTLSADLGQIYWHIKISHTKFMQRRTKKLSPPTFSFVWAYLYLYLTPPQSHFLSGVESVLSISIDSEIGSSCIYPISVFWSLTSLKGMTIFRRRFYDVSFWEGVTTTVCHSLSWILVLPQTLTICWGSEKSLILIFIN